MTLSEINIIAGRVPRSVTEPQKASIGLRHLDVTKATAEANNKGCTDRGVNFRRYRVLSDPQDLPKYWPETTLF